MADEPKKPLEDLKEGLGLLFRAAKGAVENLPTEKVEGVAKDAVKEVGKAFDTIGGEIDKVWNKATGSQAPAKASAEEKKEEPAAPAAPEQPYDDAYAPEPPKGGPRVG